MGDKELLSKITEELSNLALFVDKTRKGMDALESTVKFGSEKFPEAASQLSSVTGELENAANNIMNILEFLMQEQDRGQTILKELSVWAGTLAADNRAKGEGLIKELDSINAKTKKEMMEIFSNMSFQDLTGQKLKKVITGLGAVESKLIELALNFGFDDATKEKRKEMLKGLKISEVAPINQNVVDELLKELGRA